MLLDYFYWSWCLRNYLFSCSANKHFLLSFVCLPTPSRLMCLLHWCTSALWIVDLSLKLEESFPGRRRDHDFSTLLGMSSLSLDHLPCQSPILLCWSVSHIPLRFLPPAALQLSGITWPFYDIGFQWNVRQKSHSTTRSLQLTVRVVYWTIPLQLFWGLLWRICRSLHLRFAGGSILSWMPLCDLEDL